MGLPADVAFKSRDNSSIQESIVILLHNYYEGLV
jgi:hypothetical protein